MMSDNESKEQNNFKRISSPNLGSSFEKEKEDLNLNPITNQIELPLLPLNSDLTENINIDYNISMKKQTKTYINIDKIIRNGDSEKQDSELNLNEAETGTFNNIETAIELEAEINETSTCPSKLKNKRDRRDDECSSSSKSSYHNRKKKKRASKKSRSKSRSRSKRRDRKYDKSDKHGKRHRKRSRSRPRSRSRSRSDSKRHSKRKSRLDTKHKRKRSPSHSSSESTIKKRNYFEERRKARTRERSNSALRVMKLKNLENACGYYQRYYQRPHEDNDPNKPQLHWDGYQWVIRPTSISDNPFDIIKPGRKVQIANVPLHLNIQVHLFKDYLVTKISERNVVSKKDVKDINNIIRGIELDYENNTAIIAMESTDLAKRMVLLDGLILLGHTLRFSPYQDVNNKDNASNVVKAQALADSAHLSAKSAAIAFAALKSLGNKNETVQINLQGDVQSTLPSFKVVKVMNLVDPKESAKIKGDRLEEILDDIKEEFSKYGNIVSAVIIKPKNEKIGAECGAVFVEFQEIKSAENSVKNMKGKRYEAREIKMSFIDEEVFKKEIL